jgi:hypothetical protein
MGYRSDVTATFYVKDAKHLPILKIWLTANFPMEVFKDSIRWFDRGIVLSEENVKWYDDYDEVKTFNYAVQKYLMLMDEKGTSNDFPVFSYEFVRLGENYDDIVTEYEGVDCECILGVSRSITCEV